MLDQSAGLGEWVAVTKRDSQGQDTELQHAEDAQEAADAHDPLSRDATWRERAVKTKGEIRTPTDWTGRLRTAAGAAPYVAIGCLVAFVAIVAVQRVGSSLDPLRHMVSEYANGSAGPLMVVGFALWAASFGLAAVAVLRCALRPRWRVALAVLLGIACLGAVVTAAFATQTVAGKLPPGVEWTARGRLHDAGSGLLILALLGAAVVSCFAGVSQRLRRLTIALLGAAVVVDVGLLLVGAPVGGLRQRLLLAIGCAWELCLLAWLVRRQRAETHVAARLRRQRPGAPDRRA